jgi:uncharacterized protein YidB (DUF937 family)
MRAAAAMAAATFLLRGDVMGAFKDLAGRVVKRVVHSETAQRALGAVFEKVDLVALGKRFEGAGLEKVFASWVSQGKNLPISPDQVKGLLGEEHLQQLASEHNVSPEEMQTLLAQHLPDLVDHLTPDGKLPAES